MRAPRKRTDKNSGSTVPPPGATSRIWGKWIFLSRPSYPWMVAFGIVLGVYGLALLSFTTGHPWAGGICIGLSLYLFTLLIRPGLVNEKAALLSAFLGVVLIGAGLSSFPSFAWNFPSRHPFDLPKPLYFILTGGLLVFLCFRILRPEPRIRPEIQGRTAGFWLIAILGMTAWLRLCHFQDPYAMYWDDFAISMIDGRGVVDFGEHHMLFPLGDRQPFYNYLVVLVYYLFPGWNSITVQNVTWAGIDIAATWMLYLLGRKAGGRRVGLIVAAFAAVSKPFLISCLTGQSLIPTSLFIATSLFFTFRVLEKTDLRRSLEWGAAIAFGAYCYQTGRPYIWLLVIAVLFSILADPKERRAGRLFWVLGAGLALVWTLAFFYFNNFLPMGSGWVKALANHWTLGAAALAAGVGIYFLRPRVIRGKPGLKVVHWAMGVLAAGVLMFPILRHPDFAAHASALSIFHKDGQFQMTGVVLSQAFQKIFTTLKTVFITGFDRADMGLPGEGFFDLPGELLAIVGLIYFLARPNWIRGFLLTCAVVGLIPHVFSTGSDPHSGKLLGIVAPLLLLGAMGCERILQGFSGVRRSSIWLSLFLLMGMGLVGWGAWAMYQRFYVIIPSRATADSLIHEQVQRDSPRFKIFLHSSPFFFSVATQGTLNEGYDVRLLRDSVNVIDIEPGAPKPDVLVLLSGNEKALIDRFRNEFPAGRWEETRIYSQQPQDASFMKRIYIPAEAVGIAAPTGSVPKLIQFREVPSPSWRRCLYAHRVGLGRGIMKWEDRVQDPWGSIIPGSEGLLSARVEGVIRIPADGKYTFSVKSGNYAVLTLGEIRIFNSRPKMRVADVQRKVRLKAGFYPVVLLTYFQMGLQVPEILVQFPGETAQRRLGSW